MKLYRVNYELHQKGTLLVLADSKLDVPKKFLQYPIDQMIRACEEGNGPYFCEDCDIEEVKNIM
jgi:hypothetical protein